MPLTKIGLLFALLALIPTISLTAAEASYLQKAPATRQSHRTNPQYRAGWRFKVTRTQSQVGIEHRGSQAATLDLGIEAEWIEHIEAIDGNGPKRSVREVLRAERRQAGHSRELVGHGNKFILYGSEGERLYDNDTQKGIEDKDVTEALAGPLFLQLWPPARLYSGREWCFTGDDLDALLKPLGLKFASLTLRVERIVKEPATGLDTAHLRGDLYASLPYMGDYADLQASVEIDLPLALGVPFRTEIIGGYNGKGRSDLDPRPTVTGEYRFRQTLSPDKSVLAALRGPALTEPQPQPREQKPHNPRATSRLAAAIKKNDHGSVQLLLKIGADPQTPGESGCPVLFDTLLHEEDTVRGSMVRELLDAGARADLTCPPHGSPLALALKRNLPDGIVRFLVEAGADVNVTDEQGRTPLMLAMDRYTRQTELAALLLSHGADPNLTDRNGDGALDYAITDANKETIRLLIEQGADMDAPNRSGRPPLLVAAQRWHDGQAGGQGHKRTTTSGKSPPAPRVSALGMRERDAMRQLLRAGADLNAALRAAEPGSDAYRRLLAAGLRERVKCGGVAQVNSLLQRGGDVHARWDDDVQCPLLFDAVATWGDEIGMVELLLKAGAPVNQPCRSEPLLIRSISTSPLPVVRQLLQHGAQVNAQAGDGTTALQKALFRNDPEEELQVVEMLLRAGADVRLRNADRETVLHQAAYLGSEQTLERLIAAGAQVDARDKLGRTPLMIALNNKKKANADMLLRAGADINVRNSSGATPFHEAAEGGKVELLKQLRAAGAAIDARNSWGETVLMSAAKKGRIEAMDWLLKQGADANAVDENQRTALHLVAQLIDWEYQKGSQAVRFLLTAGTEIDHQDSEGVTALMKMTERGHAEGAAMLLDAGANPHLRDHIGRSALSYAAWGYDDNGKTLKAKLEIAKRLLRLGADPNVRGKWEMTPLMLAADQHNDRVDLLLMDELLNYGADPGLLDEHDKPAVDRLLNPLDSLRSAKLWGCHRVVALLEGRIQDATTAPEIPQGRYTFPVWDVEAPDEIGRTRLMRAAMSGYPAAVSYFLARGADVNATGKMGLTALMLAASNDFPEVVELLLKQGAVPDMRMDNGLTALILAAQEGHDRIAQALLNGKARLDLQDEDGRSALFNAVAYRRPEVVSLLLEHGADPNRVDNSGLTPLMAAALEGNAEMARLLVDGGADIQAAGKNGITATDIARYKEHDAVLQLLQQSGKR